MPVPGAGESIYRSEGLNLLYPLDNELNLQACLLQVISRQMPQ